MVLLGRVVCLSPGAPASCRLSVPLFPLDPNACLPSTRNHTTPTLLTAVPAAAPALALGVSVSNTRPAVAQGGAVHIRAVDLDALVQKSSAAKTILADFQNFQKAKQSELQK